MKLHSFLRSISQSVSQLRVNQITSIKERYSSVSFQKLDLEIQGHLPIIEKVQGRGDKLIEERHINAKQIKDKLQELQVSWDDLLNKSKIRKKNLDLSVQIQRVGLMLQ